MSFLTLASNLTLSPSHLYSVAWRYYRALRSHYVGEHIFKKTVAFGHRLGEHKDGDKATIFELPLVMEIYSLLLDRKSVV